MPRKSTRSSFKKSPSRSTSSRRTGSAIHRVHRKIRKLSPERKMDIIGVFLLILGVISLFGFIGTTGGGVTNWVVRILGWIAGMGAMLFPLMLLLVGLWFIVRNEQRFPMISVERLLGILFLFLNVLGWLHWFSGGGWELANEGGGGGYIGAFFERLLVLALGDWGALVVLVA